MTDISGKFFDKFALTFDTFYDQQRSPFMQWIDRKFRSDMFLRFELTFKWMGELTGMHVLDVGCGSGPYLQETLNHGAAQAVGIDPARGMLELARQRLSKNANSDRLVLIEGYFPTVIPSSTFDYGIVMGVMDYIDQPLHFLRALKPFIIRGAAISFPSDHWFRTPLRKIRYRMRNCPVYFYTPEIIQNLMDQAGFMNTEIYKIPGAGMDYFVWATP